MAHIEYYNSTKYSNSISNYGTSYLCKCLTGKKSYGEDMIFFKHEYYKCIYFYKASSCLLFFNFIKKKSHSNNAFCIVTDKICN